MSLVLKESRNNRQLFLAKLDIAWSRYITLMQCFDNLLHLPVNPLPLSSSKKHLFFILKANRLLQLCQLNPSVIAGAVFCNSRILASQLTPEVTFYLTLMSNVNASSPVTNVPNSMTDLPPDVELKYVYLSRRTIASILKFNHVYVGSHIRMKKEHSKVAISTPLTVSSGSEGDVDSGNCSESLRGLDQKNRKVMHPNPIQNYELQRNFTSTLSEEEDSGVHSQSPLLSHKNVLSEFKKIFCDNQATMARERFEFPGVSSEKDEPEKMVLFVQRCGACTLLLLLKKKYENKVLKYLWNCGFSLLKDLEHGAEKMLENYVHTDATSYLLLYNNAQEILKEHPCFAHTRFSEKLTKEIVSNLQEDFISDPSLHLMCLM
ncbi:uncharacterized protein LOC129224757 [Uloborus diversus]|uniref:uncharacterized protein LOC129224757 n=1 Tax=Uloborus diversus TaxID=327109 RepID=UPI002409EA82|nr:uncharacterized protein LOC129224757 [Uloborus diversus]